jgi:acyl carrier protein
MVVETNRLKGLPPQQGTLRSRLLAILSDLFQVPLNPESGDILQQELDVWDSFNHLRLVLELEQIFGITLSDVDTLEMTSLNKMELLLQARGIS